METDNENEKLKEEVKLLKQENQRLQKIVEQIKTLKEEVKLLKQENQIFRKNSQ